ncbi:MAG: hypothetical protein KatS3mg054_0118 [Chloroflexus sp.]|nr:MAG: hypothetical protein KatS3mg054_0118 [Chloroflexus sp.]
MPQYVPLVVIYPAGSQFPKSGYDPIADGSSTLIGLSGGDLIVGASRRPVTPALVEWPTFSRSISVQPRQVRFASLSIRVANGGSVARSINLGDWPRMRLFLCLQDSGYIHSPLPILDARIVNYVLNPANDSLVLDAVEYEQGMGAPFPGGPMTVADFPSMPAEYSGVVNRQIIIGESNFHIPLIQIDRDGFEYYVAEPPMQRTPTAVFVSGQRVDPLSYRWDIGVTANGTRYTKLVLSEPISSLSLGVPGIVTAYGGKGLNYDSAIRLIAESQDVSIGGGFVAMLADVGMRFPVASIINKRANGFELLFERYMPQTTYAPYFSPTGELEAVNMDFRASSPLTISRSNGIIGLISVEKNPVTEVFNDIQIDVGTTFRGQQSRRPLISVVRNAEIGPPEIRSILALSRNLYGTRFMQIDAGDLAPEIDGLGRPVSSNAAERLADFLSITLSFSNHSYKYVCSYDLALSVVPGQSARIIDESIGLDTIAIIKQVDYGVQPILTIEAIEQWKEY